MVTRRDRFGLEDQRARVAAQLGGVDPGPRRAGRGCPRTARRAAAPASGGDRRRSGSGARPRSRRRLPALEPLLLRLGDVDALEVEREARRGQRAAEAAHELVVAAAAAEDVAERRVVDLEDRAGVVAEVAQQAEVEPDPVGDAAGAQRLEGLAASRAVARSVASPPSPRARSSTSGPPRSSGTAISISRSPAPSVERRRPRPRARRGRGVARQSRIAARARSPDPELARAAGGRGRRRRARSPRGSSPAASSAAASTSTTSAVPSGRGRADQLDPGLGELAHLAALGADRAVGAGEVAEPERRLGGRRSGWRPGARSEPSCRSASPAARRDSSKKR